MINSIKNRFYIIIKKAKDKSGINKLEGLLQDSLGGVLDKVLLDRRSNIENSNFSPEDFDKITNRYMKMNVALATASSIIPGPAGLITAVPNMITSMSNQMKASYDIACIHDRENEVVSDNLLEVMIQSLGGKTSSSNLQKVNSLSNANGFGMGGKVAELSKTVARKKMKSALTRMIPGLSTIFAVIDAKKETMKVISTSNSFYNPINTTKIDTKEFQFSEEQLFEEKIRLLINLLTIDGKTAPEEISFITPLIDNSMLTFEKKEAYTASLYKSFTDYSIDFDLIKKAGDGDEIIVDLAVLSKRDHDVAQEELDYISHAAEKLEIDEMVYQKVLDESYLEYVKK